MRHIFPSFGTHISDLKTIINFRPFTLARMPAKVVLKIAGAKNAQNSRASAIV